MGRKLFLLVLAIFMAAFAFTVFRSDGHPGFAIETGTVRGSLMQKPRSLPAFKMLDENGQPFGVDELRGSWTLMFFGYTSCPDVCPTTMATLQNVLKELGDIENAPRVVLVTVDPGRDDAKTLAAYVKHFGAQFTGVRGADDQLHKLALAVGAMYERGTADENGDYDVAHSASIFLIDPHARVHAAFPPPLQAKDLARRFMEISRG